MRPQNTATTLIICLLACTNLQAQFFYPKKCIYPDSIFTEFQPGTLNVWASGGFRSAKTDGQRENNWFSSVSLNYIPVKHLETGIHFNKSIPRNASYSYQHSVEYVPYLRYSLLANGCYKYALWCDFSYHLDRKRTKDVLLNRTDAPAAGFGVYKTLGRFLWLETHSEFFIGQKTLRQEFRLVWKMMNIRFGKKETRRVNLNVPLPTF